MQKPVSVNEAEANRIIRQGDIQRFNEIIPIPMREDRASKRLDIYSKRLAEDVTKTETDPTRTSAAFLLGRDQYHGASNAGAIIKLAMLHMNVDSDLVNQFDWSYANVDNYVAQRIGLWDPLIATPVMNQGHWQEAVIRARLESEKGYRFDPELLDKINAYTLPGYDDIRSTNDAAGYRADGIQVIGELKTIADPVHKFDRVEDIHFMQSQVQALLMEKSEMGFQQHEIHYPEFATGKIHTFRTEIVPELQELYIKGTEIANEYITAGHLPNLDKVQVTTLPFNQEEKELVNDLLSVVEGASMVEKKAKSRKTEANAALRELFKKNGMGKDEVSAKNLSQGTNRPAGTMKVFYVDRFNAAKVVEEAKKYGVYEQALVPNEEISDGHRAALDALKENGIVGETFNDVELDFDLAMELLAERGVETELFYNRTLTVSSVEVKSEAENRKDARSYSETLREVGYAAADDAIQATRSEKTPVVLLQDRNAIEKTAEQAPTVDTVAAPIMKPDNM